MNELYFLFLVPIGVLGVQVRQRRIDMACPDRFAAWFTHFRFQQRLALLTACVWVFALVLTDGHRRLASYLRELLPWGAPRACALVLCLPPAAILIAAKLLAAPVFARVPEVGWTRGKLLAQALWGWGGVLAAIYLFVWGVEETLAAVSSRSMFLGIIGALVIGQVAFMGWTSARNWPRMPLPQGPLRERLFDMAEDLAIRVRRAHVLPPAFWRLLNVFDHRSGTCYVAPIVLPHLSKREMDALLAQELVRQRRGVLDHLLNSSPATIPMIFLLSFAMIAISCFNFNFDRMWPLALICLLPGAGLEIGDHLSRRHDRASVALTLDAEALITALAKLHRLGLLPLAIERPTDFADRLREIAFRAGIPDERLREILAGPGTGTDRYPPLPDPAPAWSLWR